MLNLKEFREGCRVDPLVPNQTQKQLQNRLQYNSLGGHHREFMTPASRPRRAPGLPSEETPECCDTATDQRGDEATLGGAQEEGVEGLVVAP